MTVRIEQKQRYAIIFIDRPEALNSLNQEALGDLSRAIKSLEGEAASNASLRAFVIAGAGDKSFIAGADIAEMASFTSVELEPEERSSAAESFSKKGQDALNIISDSKLISVAAINGFALGGGLELALACDLRLASDTSLIGLPETGLGLIPGFGGTQRLPRLIGKAAALEMILFASKISAQRAYEIGLIQKLFPKDTFWKDLNDFMDKLLSGKSSLAQKAAIHGVEKGIQMSLEEGLALERRLFGSLFQCEGAKEAVNNPDKPQDGPQEGITAFLKKRKPNFP